MHTDTINTWRCRPSRATWLPESLIRLDSGALSCQCERGVRSEQEE